MTVGETSEDQLERIIAEGGRRGEVYGRMKALCDVDANEIRRRYPKDLPRRVSGYNLDDLLPEKGFHVARALSGTEGTCVTVLGASLHLVPSPAFKSLLVLGYPDVYEAGDHVPEILEAHPIGLEGLDDILVHDMRKKEIHPQDVKLLPEGGGWLLLEFGGESKEESDAKAHALMNRLKKSRIVPARNSSPTRLRRSTSGRCVNPAWEPRLAFQEKKMRGRVGRIRRFRRTVLVPTCATFASCLRSLVTTVHFTATSARVASIRGSTLTSRAMRESTTFGRFLNEAADLVASHGGSISGEHGDGQSKAALLPRMFGPELVQAFAEFKAIWDPDHKMNPNRVVDPALPGENLRLGPTYRPPQLETHFQFPGDNGSPAYATERCVGIGECRKEENGTMCPSYMVTKEEMHSTRGRAHLLFEMLQGDPMKGGWRNESVREALDLCVACKGCRSECPMNVDMATYKAEFLSHYFEGRPQPRHAYAMGLIYWWARVVHSCRDWSIYCRACRSWRRRSR